METFNLKDISLLRSVNSYYINIEHKGLIYCFGITESKGDLDCFNLIEVFKVNDGNKHSYNKLKNSVKKQLKRFAEEKFKEYISK